MKLFEDYYYFLGGGGRGREGGRGARILMKGRRVDGCEKGIGGGRGREEGRGGHEG